MPTDQIEVQPHRLNALQVLTIATLVMGAGLFRFPTPDEASLYGASFWPVDPKNTVPLLAIGSYAWALWSMGVLYLKDILSRKRFARQQRGLFLGMSGTILWVTTMYLLEFFGPA